MKQNFVFGLVKSKILTPKQFNRVIMGVSHLRLIFATLNASSGVTFFTIKIIRYLVFSPYRPTLGASY